MMPSDDEAVGFYAQTYDAWVPGWSGEIAFYQQLAAQLADGRAVLEVACGTGRVAIRLARSGVEVVGIDRSPAMLEVAREKSLGMSNVRWVEADMRSFQLAEAFMLVIIPGHSFQNLLTSDDQARCLESIRRHLLPGGTLVVHLDQPDVAWLDDIAGGRAGVFETAERFLHPRTGLEVRAQRAWWYQTSTRTATARTVWEEFDAVRNLTGRWDSGPTRYRCVFRSEMEHLLTRTGFQVENLYGDFHRRAFDEQSAEMIWVATRIGQAPRLTSRSLGMDLCLPRNAHVPAVRTGVRS